MNSIIQLAECLVGKHDSFFIFGIFDKSQVVADEIIIHLIWLFYIKNLSYQKPVMTIISDLGFFFRKKSEIVFLIRFF